MKNELTERIVEENLKLVPYYPAENITLAWYQDKELCRQVDGVGEPYSLDKLRRMYSYLCNNGECFYITYFDQPIGDVSLKNDGEIAIVLCREYQNRHIGRKCVEEIIKLAKEKEYKKVKANIYSFNVQSMRMFRSIGFVSTEEGSFELIL